MQRNNQYPQSEIRIVGKFREAEYLVTRFPTCLMAERFRKLNDPDAGLAHETPTYAESWNELLGYLQQSCDADPNAGRRLASIRLL